MFIIQADKFSSVISRNRKLAQILKYFAQLINEEGNAKFLPTLDT